MLRYTIRPFEFILGIQFQFDLTDTLSFSLYERTAIALTRRLSAPVRQIISIRKQQPNLSGNPGKCRVDLCLRKKIERAPVFGPQVHLVQPIHATPIKRRDKKRPQRIFADLSWIVRENPLGPRSSAAHSSAL